MGYEVLWSEICKKREFNFRPNENKTHAHNGHENPYGTFDGREWRVSKI